MTDPFAVGRIGALGLAALVVGSAYIWAALAGRVRLALWLKALPVALALLVTLLAGWQLPPPVAPLYRTLIATGLLLSMVGDILLALPREQFEAGLGAFLAAHLVYITAFVTRAGFHAAPVALVLLFIYGAGFMALVLPRVQAGWLRAAVSLYTVVLLAMIWQAAGMWQAMGDRGSALALAGAFFFVISDSVLAWNRFRKRLKLAISLVLVTYYLAQWLLALSVLA